MAAQVQQQPMNGMGMSFSQVHSEISEGEDQPSTNDMKLSQIATVMVNLSEQNSEQLDKYLAQIESIEETANDNILSQINAAEDDHMAQLANILAQLDETELAQVE